MITAAARMAPCQRRTGSGHGASGQPELGGLLAALTVYALSETLSAKRFIVHSASC